MRRYHFAWPRHWSRARLERYDQYATTAETFTLYEHCRRAVEKGTTAGVARVAADGQRRLERWDEPSGH